MTARCAPLASFTPLPFARCSDAAVAPAAPGPAARAEAARAEARAPPARPAQVARPAPPERPVPLEPPASVGAEEAPPPVRPGVAAVRAVVEEARVPAPVPAVAR